MEKIMAVIQMDFMASTIQRFTGIHVLLPCDQADAVNKGPFPTLYLLHGYYGNYTDWLYNSRIALWAQQRNLAVVMPSGENAYYLDYPERAECFEAYIAKELVEVTRKAFPLSEKREDTWIAGLSMGGGGAIRCALHYGEVFGKAAGLSAGLTIHEEAKALEHQADVMQALTEAIAQKRPLPQIFLTIGTEDPLLADNREYHAYLQQNGIAHRYEEHPGGHNWDYWDGHILDVLDWLQRGGTSWQS